MPIVSSRVVLVVNILIYQYFDGDETIADISFTESKKNQKKKPNAISCPPFVGFAWQMFVHIPIALLSGRASVQILNIYPCPWTDNPPTGGGSDL
jgi:hypothetical protein